MKLFSALLAMIFLSAGGAWAGHANPWASEGDILQMQYHEENLAKSVGTPGEDEMRGIMVQKAHGKLDGKAGGTSVGAGTGQARGGSTGGGSRSGRGHGPGGH